MGVPVIASPINDLPAAFEQLAATQSNVGRMRAAGVKISREPGPVKFGTTLIAFIEDPDGYKIELIQAA